MKRSTSIYIFFIVSDIDIKYLSIGAGTRYPPMVQAIYINLTKGDINMAGGRPWMFKTKEELQERITEYFESCASHPITDDEGNIMTDKHGNPVYTPEKPLTVTGLALACGFNSRQALLNYQGRKEFNDTITRAKAIVEAYAEGRLFDKDGSNGAKFSLANNFEGWKEKQSIEADVSNEVTINIELTDEE